MLQTIDSASDFNVHIPQELVQKNHARIQQAKSRGLRAWDMVKFCVEEHQRERALCKNSEDSQKGRAALAFDSLDWQQHYQFVDFVQRCTGVAIDQPHGTAFWLHSSEQRTAIATALKIATEMRALFPMALTASDFHNYQLEHYYQQKQQGEQHD